MADKGVRFIRVNGRVVPIRAKKDYHGEKSLAVGAAVATGAQLTSRKPAQRAADKGIKFSKQASRLNLLAGKLESKHKTLMKASDTYLASPAKSGALKSINFAVKADLARAKAVSASSLAGWAGNKSVKAFRAAKAWKSGKAAFGLGALAALASYAFTPRSKK